MPTTTIEKWDIFEAAFDGPAEGNPYVEIAFDAVLRDAAGTEIRVPGFYDGAGVYRLRFMPEAEGDWTFVTRSATPALDGHRGGFTALAPGAGNHGPVRVRNGFHFAHADGTPFLSFGTTCYAWTHQPMAMQDQTLRSLAATRFNKIRMAVFPKDYPYNTNPPLHDIFEVVDGTRDFDRPNFEALRHFETRIGQLRDLGIEADVILFHPYDRWGYCDMSEAQDNRYVAHMAARLGAFRNVWWALANEYDFMIDTKPMDRWDGFFRILETEDPHRHLKSIHNGHADANYDHAKPWVTHVCIQHPDVKRTQDWRAAWGKPVVNDEPEYEGDIIQCWGNITAQELTHRFWTTMMRGGYAGHGETYSHPEDLIWWAKGGELHGEAWKRIGFLRDILEEDVRDGFEPIGPEAAWPWHRISGARDGDTTIIYFGEHQPSIWTIGLPKEDGDYTLDLIDTWAMTVTPLDKVPAPANHPVRHGDIVQPSAPDAAFAVRLPRRPHLALRCRKVR